MAGQNASGTVTLEYVADPTKRSWGDFFYALGEIASLPVRIPPLGFAAAYAWWAMTWSGEHSPVLPVLIVVVFAVALLGWRHRWPASYARWVSRPTIGRLRRVFVYARMWQPAMVTTGLAIRPWSAAETLPRMGRSRRTDSGDVLTAHMLPGQTLEDWSLAAPALAQTFGAVACRVTSCAGRPRLVRLAFTTRDALDNPVRPFATPSIDAVDLEAVPIARTEDGDIFTMPLLYAHTLIAGETGSGKGSVLWSIIAGVAPAIQSGNVQVWAVDPKGGMELGGGSPLFARFACGAPLSGADGAARAWQSDMLDLLDDAVQVMQARAARLRGISRKHVPTAAEPLIVVLIDELAALTTYMPDSALRKRLNASIGLLLSQGRAVGVSVVGATQDARKETLSFRDLFTHRIALRTAEADMTDLILGAGSRARGARTDQIDPRTPGVAYVVQDGHPEPVRVRVSYLSDDDIAELARSYRLCGSPVPSAAPTAAEEPYVVDKPSPAADLRLVPDEPLSFPDPTAPIEGTFDAQHVAEREPRSAPPSMGTRRPRSPRKPRAPRSSTRDRSASTDGEPA